MLWTDKAKKYLLKWDITELKDKQFTVINELLLGNDVIGLLPTGYGKSLCYLLPPLVTKKIMFIISPLISLMDDQKDKLIKMKIPCAALHSNNKNKDLELLNVINGKIKIVYMSPEYLINGEGMKIAEDLIKNNQLGFLAVDESHCISVWGQDFRPEYANIKQFRVQFPTIPILAVTATATNNVCNDISTFLHLSNPILVKASFDRPNLYLKICDIPPEEMITRSKRIKQKSKLSIVLPYLSKYPNEKIIIYINSRKDCESLAFELNKKYNNICSAYHAGMNANTRGIIHNQFIEGEINIIISTTAFGMGIDQIVKCVIIIGFPSAIEEYYQQIGRGGRDGLYCETVLYFDYSNLIIAESMINKIRRDFPILAKAKETNIYNMKRLVFTPLCRRRFILNYFNQLFSFYVCNNCDNCCENKLIDMTDKFWSIIFNNKITCEQSANEIKKTYLTEYMYVDKNNKHKQQELFLSNDINIWKRFIIANKLTQTTIPDNCKLMIPEKFIKLTNTNIVINTDDFESKIKTYEKLLN
jgi:RecQ family ATP-dependent DNA helicase